MDVRQEDYVFCLASDGLIMLAQENSPCFVDKRKGGHSLVQFCVAIENKKLHSQDFCHELRTSWSVTLQYSRSFRVYNLDLI